MKILLHWIIPIVVGVLLSRGMLIAAEERFGEITPFLWVFCLVVAPFVGAFGTSILTHQFYTGE
jgi:hypothetical protein